MVAVTAVAVADCSNQLALTAWQAKLWNDAFLTKKTRIFSETFTFTHAIDSFFAVVYLLATYAQAALTAIVHWPSLI